MLFWVAKLVYYRQMLSGHIVTNTSNMQEGVNIKFSFDMNTIIIVYYELTTVRIRTII